MHKHSACSRARRQKRFPYGCLYQLASTTIKHETRYWELIGDRTNVSLDFNVKLYFILFMSLVSYLTLIDLIITLKNIVFVENWKNFKSKLLGLTLMRIRKIIFGLKYFICTFIFSEIYISRMYFLCQLISHESACLSSRLFCTERNYFLRLVNKFSKTS